MRRAFLLGLGAVLLHATDAWACLCRSTTVADAARTADAVFAGRVLATRIAPDVAVGRQLEATVVVERRWKGGRDSVVVVRTLPPGGPCAFPFQTGNTYLVYANRETPGALLHTSICYRTARLSHRLGDVAVLGPGVRVGDAYDQPRSPLGQASPRREPPRGRITAPDDA